MSNIVAYKVREVMGDRSELEAQIKRDIETGWQPLGGVSVAYHRMASDEVTILCQAVVKYEEEE